MTKLSRRTWLAAMAALPFLKWLAPAQAAPPKPKRKIWIGHSWPK